MIRDYLRRYRRAWQLHPAVCVTSDVALPICIVLTLAGFFPVVAAVALAIVACAASLVTFPPASSTTSRSPNPEEPVRG